MIKNQISKRKCKKYICERCFNPFTSQQVLDKHIICCSKFAPAREVFPSNAILKFSKIEHQLPCPFIIAADIETFQQPIHTAKPSPSISSTTAEFNHIPCSASYVIISSDGSFYQKPKLFK